MHPQAAPTFDTAFSALLEDLDQRGMLDETLLLVNAEFGRTPTINKNAGRDHWPWVYSLVMAGAGVRSGVVYGATDDFGYYAVQDKVHVHDLHATILHLLGLDHKRLTYRFSGRDMRLTDVHGELIHGMLA